MHDLAAAPSVTLSNRAGQVLADKAALAPIAWRRPRFIDGGKMHTIGMRNGANVAKPTGLDACDEDGGLFAAFGGGATPLRP